MGVEEEDDLELAPIKPVKPVAGCALDWSGMTCIALCEAAGCGWVGGPWFSVVEARSAAQGHYRLSHNFCSVERCVNARQSGKGLCSTHDPKAKKTKPPCSVEGCGKLGIRRGMCHAHYAATHTSKYAKPLCKSALCENPAISKGECAKHYQRSLRTQKQALMPKVEKPARPETCSVCERPYFSSGYCRNHYESQRRARKRREAQGG